MGKPTKQYRTLVNRKFGHIRFAVDYEPYYWGFGVTVGIWYLRVDIGPYGFAVMKQRGGGFL